MGKIEMLEQDMSGLDERDYSDEFLDSAKAWIQKWGWGFSVLMVLIWPVLSFPAGVFTKEYFAFWIFISIIWSAVATAVIIVLPIYESMDAIKGGCLFLIGRKSAALPKQSPGIAQGDFLVFGDERRTIPRPPPSPLCFPFWLLRLLLCDDP